MEITLIILIKHEKNSDERLVRKKQLQSWEETLESRLVTLKLIKAHLKLIFASKILKILQKMRTFQYFFSPKFSQNMATTTYINMTYSFRAHSYLSPDTFSLRQVSSDMMRNMDCSCASNQTTLTVSKSSSILTRKTSSAILQRLPFYSV